MYKYRGFKGLLVVDTQCLAESAEHPGGGAVGLFYWRGLGSDGRCRRSRAGLDASGLRDTACKVALKGRHSSRANLRPEKSLELLHRTGSNGGGGLLRARALALTSGRQNRNGMLHRTACLQSLVRQVGANQRQPTQVGR